MNEPLIPDQQGGADKNARDEGLRYASENVTPSRGDEPGESETPIIKIILKSGVVFVALECLAMVCWQVSDDLPGYWRLIVHWLSLVLIAAGPIEVIREVFPENKRYMIYWGFCAVCIALGAIACVAWFPKQEVTQPSPAPAPSVDTKQQLRTFLEQINPKILEMVDSGVTQVPVMLSDYHVTKLREFAEAPDFGKYLSFQETGSRIIASQGSHIGDFLDDNENSPSSTGYILIPKDALRRAVAAMDGTDYIPGTKFTHSQLESMFPFGYTVFSTTENRQWKYEVFNTKLAKWEFDWGNVKIEPNFGTETVTWRIPALSVAFPNGAQVKEDIMVATTPFKSGTVKFARAIASPNNPGLFIGTLSDDQRNPVFVLGMRIPSIKEMMDGVSVDMH